ncbi:nuclear factor of activated T-cells 5-like isoform X2 [Xenia sp. Carnegie-2017]|uniref:nuclear factor of activated T-cells 5-like isoform X2 n=1 Tax=Xenia sp. Carnegie-2017 TaxID=2897299 RepID=UPI001F04C1C4|nr:nuclear factor of activated T-cells 5-like isoform X2 [Xenia sp. Carnegie-2017]
MFDMSENLLHGFPCVDSPSSVDSGNSSSPSSPHLATDGSFSSGQESPVEKSLSSPDVWESQLSPTKTSAVPAAEKTVKKLLELLVAAKTAGERSLISNLLTTLVTNSLAKNNPSLHKSLVIKSDSQNKQTAGVKRPASLGNESIINKKQKTAPCSIPIKPSIVMIEEPEKNYRARYESEGCRGPVHGSTELTFPTFMVQGYNAPLWVTVYLATSNGTPHFHLLCGPGSTKLPCRNITLKDEVTAIQVLVGPETEMTAVLDCISLKRRRNFEADKELRRRGLNPANWKSERKEACFVMTAEIPGSPKQTISCKSKVFQCTAPPGNPEIWWMKPVEGSVTGGDEIGIIGKKFLKGFQVRFYGELPSGEGWEAYGEINRSKSNTGACVVKSPPLPASCVTSPLSVNVEISGDIANNYTSSDSVPFTYVPVPPPAPEPKAIVSPLDEELPSLDQDTQELYDLFRDISQVTTDSAYILDLGIDALDKEWKQILDSIEELYRTKQITEFQQKELKFLVSQHDTILLEAFRTTKHSVTDSEFLHVFCQYLAGLSNSVSSN